MMPASVWPATSLMLCRRHTEASQSCAGCTARPRRPRVFVWSHARSGHAGRILAGCSSSHARRKHGVQEAHLRAGLSLQQLSAQRLAQPPALNEAQQGVQDKRAQAQQLRSQLCWRVRQRGPGGLPGGLLVLHSRAQQVQPFLEAPAGASGLSASDSVRHRKALCATRRVNPFAAHTAAQACLFCGEHLWAPPRLCQDALVLFLTSACSPTDKGAL